MERNQINGRVLEALEAILETHPELSKSKLAQSFGIKPSTFTEILKGRMNAGSDIMAYIAVNFGISPVWMLTGEGSMDADDPANAVRPGKPIGDFSALVETIREQAVEIGTLREQVRQLKERLEKTAASANTPLIANAG